MWGKVRNRINKQSALSSQYQPFSETSLYSLLSPANSWCTSLKQILETRLHTKQTCVFICVHTQKRCAAWFTAVIIKSHFLQKPPRSPGRFGQGRGIAGGDAIFRCLGGNSRLNPNLRAGSCGSSISSPLQELALPRALTSNTSSPGSLPVLSLQHRDWAAFGWEAEEREAYGNFTKQTSKER